MEMMDIDEEIETEIFSFTAMMNNVENTNHEMKEMAQVEKREEIMLVDRLRKINRRGNEVLNEMCLKLSDVIQKYNIQMYSLRIEISQHEKDKYLSTPYYYKLGKIKIKSVLHWYYTAKGKWMIPIFTEIVSHMKCYCESIVKDITIVQLKNDVYHYILISLINECLFKNVFYSSNKHSNGASVLMRNVLISRKENGNSFICSLENIFGFFQEYNEFIQHNSNSKWRQNKENWISIANKICEKLCLNLQNSALYYNIVESGNINNNTNNNIHCYNQNINNVNISNNIDSSNNNNTSFNNNSNYNNNNNCGNNNNSNNQSNYNDNKIVFGRNRGGSVVGGIVQSQLSTCLDTIKNLQNKLEQLEKEHLQLKNENAYLKKENFQLTISSSLLQQPISQAPVHNSNINTNINTKFNANANCCCYNSCDHNSQFDNISCNSTLCKPFSNVWNNNNTFCPHQQTTSMYPSSTCYHNDNNNVNNQTYKNNNNNY